MGGRRLETAGLCAVPLAFLIAGLVRAWPFVNNVTEAHSQGEDWLIYYRYANDIVQHGLWIPRLAEPYSRPAGFAYNYLLAGAFALGGPNSSYAYVLQSLLLGLSVPLMYLVVRPFLGPRLRVALLAALALLALFDVYHYYTFRLLSENFLVFLLPLCFLALVAAQRSQSVWRIVLAGFVMGITVLARPNMGSVAAAVTVLLMLTGKGGWWPRLVDATLFAGCWLALLCLMFLRDYVALGHVSLLAFTYTGDWPRLPADALGIAEFYVRRILFSIGLLPAYAPDFEIRPHWVLAWVALAVLSVMALRRRIRLGFTELLLFVFIGSYLAPILAVAQIDNYGFRMILPVVPALMSLDALLFVRLREA